MLYANAIRKWERRITPSVISQYLLVTMMFSEVVAGNRY